MKNTKIRLLTIVGICLILGIIGWCTAYYSGFIGKYDFNNRIIIKLAEAKRLQTEGKNEASLDVYNGIFERMQMVKDMSYAGAVVCGMANCYLNIGNANNDRRVTKEQLTFLKKAWKRIPNKITL